MQGRSHTIAVFHSASPISAQPNTSWCIIGDGKKLTTIAVVAVNGVVPSLGGCGQSWRIAQSIDQIRHFYNVTPGPELSEGAAGNWRRGRTG